MPNKLPKLALLLTACLLASLQEGRADNSKRKTDLRPVSLQLPWDHQSFFAGYYVAQELGFYREAGLEVEIRGRNRNFTVAECILSGQADFGVNSAVASDILIGAPLTILAAIAQRSPFVLLALKEGGIESIADLRGRKLLVSHPKMLYEIADMLRACGVSLNEVIPDSLPNTLNAILEHPEHAILAHVSGLYNEFQRRNIAFNAFDPYAYGSDLYGEFLFTSRALARKQPALAEKFRDASLKGWHYAQTNLNQAVDLMQRKYLTELSHTEIEQQLTTVLNLTDSDIVPLGYINHKRWHDRLKVMALAYNLPYDENMVNRALFDTCLAERRNQQLVLLRYALLGAGVCALGFAIISLLLRRTVRHRTEELRLTNQECRRKNLQLMEAQTSLHQQHEQSLASETNLRNLADISDGLVVVFGDDDRVRYVNRTFELITGISAVDICSGATSLESLVEDRVGEQLRQWLARQRREAIMSSTFQFMITNRRNEQVPLECRLNMVSWDGIPSPLLLAHDIGERKRFETELVRIGEWEQLRLGQDLHDTIGQQLAGMTYLLEMHLRNLTRGSTDQAAAAQELVQISKETRSQLGNVVSSLLMPDTVDDIGSSLYEHCHSVSARYGAQSRVRVSADEVRIAPPVGAHLLRIAQEAVSNAIRHGMADEIDIFLRHRSQRFLLVIRDNGSGFDPGSVSSEGFGLRIMRHRAETIGGRLLIMRHQAGGTLVICSFDPNLIHGSRRWKDRPPDNFGAADGELHKVEEV